MRFVYSGLLILFTAGVLGAQERKHNELRPEQTADGWELLFDGEVAAGLQVDGEHEIVDGALILGGKKTARAFVKRGVQPGFRLSAGHALRGKSLCGSLNSEVRLCPNELRRAISVTMQVSLEK